MPSVRWADIPQPSTRDRRCPAAWQQPRPNGTDPRPSANQPDICPVGTDRASVTRCRWLPLVAAVAVTVAVNSLQGLRTSVVCDRATALDSELIARISPEHRRRLAWFEEHQGEVSASPGPLAGGLLLVSKPKGIYKPGDLPYALSTARSRQQRGKGTHGVSSPFPATALRARNCRPNPRLTPDRSFRDVRSPGTFQLCSLPCDHSHA